MWNTSISSTGTYLIHITHNGFRSSIKKSDFNVDLFAINVNFFFKFSAAFGADYIDVASLKEVVSYFLIKHSSACWVALKRVCVRLLEQFENLRRYFFEFLPNTSTFKRTVKETDRYKRIVKSLKNEITVPYLSFITLIVNYFERFFITFQSMTPRTHLLYT